MDIYFNSAIDYRDGLNMLEHQSINLAEIEEAITDYLLTYSEFRKRQMGEHKFTPTPPSKLWANILESKGWDEPPLRMLGRIGPIKMVLAARIHYLAASIPSIRGCFKARQLL